MAAISVKHNGDKRTIEAIKVLLADKSRNITEIKVKVDGVVRIIWEAIKGYIFTSDGYAIKTSDGYFIKCNDQ